jgi:hypothetical protein
VSARCENNKARDARAPAKRIHIYFIYPSAWYSEWSALLGYYVSHVACCSFCMAYCCCSAPSSRADDATAIQEHRRSINAHLNNNYYYTRPSHFALLFLARSAFEPVNNAADATRHSTFYFWEHTKAVWKMHNETVL